MCVHVFFFSHFCQAETWQYTSKEGLSDWVSFACLKCKSLWLSRCLEIICIYYMFTTLISSNWHTVVVFQQRASLISWGLIWIKVSAPSSQTSAPRVQKASLNNEFTQIPSPERACRQVPQESSSQTASEKWTGFWQGRQWVLCGLHNPGTDCGVNNCIVLAGYSCFFPPPARLVCPSQQQMTNRHTQRGRWRNVSERCPPSNKQPLVKALGTATAAEHSARLSKSHFVWLALPWRGGVFGQYVGGMFLRLNVSRDGPHLHEYTGWVQLKSLQHLKHWILTVTRAA